MNDEPPILHTTYTIHLISYRADGRWVPHALVCSPAENEEDSHPVIGNPDDPLPTREAVDAVAKKLAIEWIDSKFPSAAD